MPALHRAFDATQIAPRDNSPIPAGEYLAMIVASEWKTTKAGDGQYLQLEMQVIEGPHANRKFWERLNLNNKNVQAVEIAERTLSAICHAVGKLNANDSEILHDIPMVVKLAVEKGQNGNENTVVKGYKAIVKSDGPAPAQQAAPVTAQATPAQRPAATGGKPAWSR